MHLFGLEQFCVEKMILFLFFDNANVLHDRFLFVGLSKKNDASVSILLISFDIDFMKDPIKRSRRHPERNQWIRTIRTNKRKRQFDKKLIRKHFVGCWCVSLLVSSLRRWPWQMMKERRTQLKYLTRRKKAQTDRERKSFVDEKFFCTIRKKIVSLDESLFWSSNDVEEEKSNLIETDQH